ncbi:Uncharacterised protein [uncultured archaeon]|nr:Uncharacterised protein [uncultured archaeon]
MGVHLRPVSRRKSRARMETGLQRKIEYPWSTEPVNHLDANVVWGGRHNIWQVAGKVDVLVTVIPPENIPAIEQFHSNGVQIVNLFPNFREVAYPATEYNDFIVLAGKKVSELVHSGKKVAICCYAGLETSRDIALFYKSLNKAVNRHGQR